jgi:hypothetical protein
MPLGTDASRGAGSPAGTGAWVVPDGRHAPRGKTVSFPHQEPICGNAERGMVMETCPAAPLEMA